MASSSSIVISPSYTDYAMVGGFASTSNTANPNADPSFPTDGVDTQYTQTLSRVNGTQIYGRSVINKIAVVKLTSTQILALADTPVQITPAVSNGWAIKLNYVLLRSGSNGTGYTVTPGTTIRVLSQSGVISGNIDAVTLLSNATELQTASALSAGTDPASNGLVLAMSANPTEGTLPLYCMVNYDIVPEDFGSELD